MSHESPSRSTAAKSAAARVAWGLSALATVVWLIAVMWFDLGDRVLDNWRAALTMLFGSFLAGSSPEGGGAVAFPVFTKALNVPGPIARTFGLSIQAVGMTMASIAIIVFRREIHIRAVIVGSIAAIVGFGAAVAAFGSPSEPFWPSSIGAPWVKATFSVVLATTSILMVRHLRQHRHSGPEAAIDHHVLVPWSRRVELSLIAVSFAGGALSSLTGTGANILVFLFLVVLVGVNPKVALPSAIMIMTAVSIVGFVLFGLIDGQLNVALADGAGSRVVSVGGQAFDGVASETDLLGLWLAAVPVVVWGAPLGSFVAARVKESRLVGFVAALAAFEVATTIFLVEEIRTEAALTVSLLVGLATVPAAMIWLERRRHQLFSSPPPRD